MKLTHQNDNQLSVLTLKGEFTADDVEQFERNVEDRLAAQARDFVLDLAELEFIDSAGLEALLKLQETCGDLLGQMRLAGACGNVEQILRMTRLTPRFDLRQSVEDAVKSLRI